MTHNGNGKFFSFQNQTLVPGSWQHMCMAATDDGITILVLNGEIIYEGLLNGASNKFKTNLWLGGSNVSHWKHRRLEGTMTDLYLWNEFINIDDLLLITTSRKESHSILAPALFSWRTFTLTASCCFESFPRKQSWG